MYLNNEVLLYFSFLDPYHEDKNYEFNIFLPVVNNLNASKFFNVTGIYLKSLKILNHYHDWQLSKVRTSFGDEVLGQITVSPQATFLVSSGNNVVACNYMLIPANDINGNKLPLKMEWGCL